jgi:hypothetical protein
LNRDIDHPARRWRDRAMAADFIAIRIVIRTVPLHRSESPMPLRK